MQTSKNLVADGKEMLPQLRRLQELEIRSADGKVTLRQYRPEDAKAIYVLIDRNRSHLSQFGDRTSENYPNLQSIEQHLIRSQSSNVLRFGILNEEGTLVGMVKLTPDFKDAKIGEIGYYLGKEFLHKGYMTRAVATLENYAFNTLNYDLLRGVVAVDNDVSARVFERLSYVPAGPKQKVATGEKDMYYMIYTKSKN
jgi:RimJ/RimL family protein N-acetyltransferase